jgi:hypothetical protein
MRVTVSITHYYGLPGTVELNFVQQAPSRDTAIARAAGVVSQLVNGGPRIESITVD